MNQDPRNFQQAAREALVDPLLRPALAVKHVGARHLVVAAAHEAELDLVLHVFYMEGAAARARAQQAADDRFREAVDGLADAGRCGSLRAMDREERLHQGDRDLVRLEGDDGAVAAQGLVPLVRRSGAGRPGRDARRCGSHRRRLSGACLHVISSAAPVGCAPPEKFC